LALWFDDTAALSISKLAELELLSVLDTKLGDTGFLQLVKLPKANSFFLSGTKVSDAVFQKAKKEYPKINFYR